MARYTIHAGSYAQRARTYFITLLIGPISILVSWSHAVLGHTPNFRCRHLWQAVDTFWRLRKEFIIAICGSVRNSDGAGWEPRALKCCDCEPNLFLGLLPSELIIANPLSISPLCLIRQRQPHLTRLRSRMGSLMDGINGRMNSQCNNMRRYSQSDNHLHSINSLDIC